MQKPFTVIACITILIAGMTQAPALYKPPHKTPKHKPSSSKIITTKTGLKYIDVKVGKGPMPKVGQTVVVNYTGTFTNGKQFDTSIGRGPFEFELGTPNIIQGWNEGVATMRVGGKRKLMIPSKLAYGPEGRDPIPPNTPLNFDIELLGIK